MNEIDLARIDLNLLVTFEALMIEGSVIRAADRLGLTASAVSHALGRLRAQLDDPLMVRVGGRMQPSPYALTLFDELRPLLRGIGRALAPLQDFAPATSERVFRVAIYAAPPLVAGIIARVRAEAPGVTLDWVAMNARLLTAVADGLVDVALVGGEVRLPDGIVSRTVEPTAWFTFARRDHPAVADWGPEAWARWPHLQVRVDNTTSSPVEGRRGQNGPGRRIGARISEFAAVAPVLAATDYLGTFPVLLLAEDLDRFGLAALEPVVRPAPFRMRFVWSARLDQDPGNRWLRGLVLAAYAAAQVAALARVRAAGVVEARRAERPHL